MWQKPLLIIFTLLLATTNGNDLVFNSSMRRQTISVSLSSHGKINTSFFIESQLLSPLLNRHQIIHGPSKIITNPELREELINFNDYYQEEYWLNIKHKVKFTGNKQVHFIGLRVIDKESVYDYLLPTFSQPFSFIRLGSIYKCGQVIVSISIQKYGIDLALFSKTGPGSWKNPKGQWGWNWNKKEFDQVDIGRYTRKDTSTPIKIQLTNGNSCEFNAQLLSKADNAGLEKSRYLSIQQVLDHSTPLPIYTQSQL